MFISVNVTILVNKLNHPKIVTKMKVLYSRVSTEDQKIDRQMKNLEGFDYVLSDYCSGSIPIWERPKGSEIKKLIDEGKLTHLEVHSIDRLGRNTISVLQVWKDLTEMGIRIVCRTPNFQNLTDEGKTDMFSELMISILSTMSDFERKLIRERQMEGVRIRKSKGLYTGRKIGTKESIQKFINKTKSQLIIKDLNNGYTIREIMEMRKCSPSTIDNVKKNMSLELIH